MRKIVFTTMLFAVTSMFAQKTRNLSIEVLGAQSTVGINYDSRFNGNSGFGYRVGIGYGYGNENNSGLFDQCINGVGVPLELNYLLGKKNSKLELGFGASLGVYREKETIGYVKDTGWYPDGDKKDETTWGIDYYTSSNTQFGYFLFGDIGYRYQRPSGFMFRAGISPSFNFGDKNGLNKSAFYPYVGFGWSF